jgi:hypothetical protein
VAGPDRAFLLGRQGQEDGHERQRQAVVEATFDVECVADQLRDPRVVDHRQPERRVGWR